jgi:hypothetical protein
VTVRVSCFSSDKELSPTLLQHCLYFSNHGLYGYRYGCFTEKGSGCARDTGTMSTICQLFEHCRASFASGSILFSAKSERQQSFFCFWLHGITIGVDLYQHLSQRTNDG